MKVLAYCITERWAQSWSQCTDLMTLHQINRWHFKSSPIPTPAVGCLYFPPDLRSFSQPKSVTIFRPVPSYTAWLQRHIGMNNLPRVVTQLCPGGNWTNDLLIASPTPYHYATAPPTGTLWNSWITQFLMISEVFCAIWQYNCQCLTTYCGISVYVASRQNSA